MTGSITRRRFGSIVLASALPPVGGQTQSPETSAISVDRVRLLLWSFFGTVQRFANDISVSPPEVERFIAEHRWDLPAAPALALQNTNLSGAPALAVSSGRTMAAGRFVTRTGAPGDPATDADIACDPGELRVSIRCEEPALDQLTAVVAGGDSRPERQRWLWSGDTVPLKRSFPNSRQLSEWATGQPTPEHSVLLDDCVLVLLAPLDIGQDRSYLFPRYFVPDPTKWVRETAPRASRIFLEGAYYAIAINPNGALLDAFFDPWESGTVCPAWHSGAEVTASRGEGFWQAEARIPWTSLCPTVNEDAVWGVDLARIRRCGSSPGEVTRSRRSTLLRYDAAPVTEPVVTPPSPPEVSVNPLPDGGANAFPSAVAWKRIPPIDEFWDIQKGGRAGDIEVRITYHEETLYVRFDCREASLDRLRVVTPADETAEYGEGNRKLNYLDRREQFGLDWGDYVEVVLAPNLGFADRYHGGTFVFLINSDGRLLDRYYDSYGMFNVWPHPLWSSGARTRVAKKGEIWSVELAVPLSVVATTGEVSSTWGLNLHRCRSAQLTGDKEAHLCWAKTRRPFEAPGWPAALRVLREGEWLGVMHLAAERVKVRPNSNRPGAAAARSAKVAAREPVKRRRESDGLSSICFVDATHGWAVGGLGTILHTADGGATWQEQASGTDFILERVFFLDRETGWAVGGWPRDGNVAIHGGMGVILATTDGGRQWRKQLDGEAAWLQDVHFADRNAGWAVGEYGTVLRTTDGGAHWEQCRQTGTPSWLYSVAFADDLHGIAVGFDETIIRTSDGGRSWDVVPGPVPRRPNAWPVVYRSVAFADRQHGWIAGEGGNLLETSDGGRSWQVSRLDLPEGTADLMSFESLAVSGDGTAWAVSPLVLLRRRPEENQWRRVGVNESVWMRAGSFPDARSGWLSGERGTILHTADGGDTWVRQRDSGRAMGVLYATAHDHHLNAGPFSVVSEPYDTAYANFGRGVRSFELRGDYNRHMVAAAATVAGVPVVQSFIEFGWRLRNHPHCIAQRYQNYGGLEGIEKRMVALIRTLRPRILFAEQPVMQEGYYAHGVGEVARAVIRAFDSAADVSRFPELLELGLEPHAVEKLYVVANWSNELYRIHPATLTISASPDQFSERLGMTFGEAKARSTGCFWGMLDRPIPPPDSRDLRTWGLHLKQSRVRIAQPETSLYGNH